MGVVHTQESAYGREIWKWDHYQDERHPVTGERGVRSREFAEFPKALFRAQRDEKAGKVLPNDVISVANETEQRNMESRGYHETQQAALDAFHAGELAVAKAHAERNFTEQRMSPKAQAEAAGYEAQVGEMVGDIPAPKKRGRPRKVTNGL